MNGARPWRAVAYVQLAPYQRLHLGRAAAKTRAGLDRFVTEREEMGATVDVWEVLPIREVAEAAQVGASSRG